MSQKLNAGGQERALQPPFQILQFRAKISLFLPKIALETADNGQRKGGSGYSTRAARLPRAKGPSRAP